MHSLLQRLSWITSTLFLSQAFPLLSVGATQRLIQNPQQLTNYISESSPIPINPKMAQNVVDEITGLVKRGNQQLDRGQFQEALETFQQLLNIVRALRSRQSAVINLEGMTLELIGRVYTELQQYPQALQSYQQALRIAQATEDKKQEGSILNGIGEVYFSWDEYSQALQFFKQALVIRQELDDKKAEGVTLNNIGAAYGRLSKFQQALELFNRALAIHRAAGSRIGEAQSLTGIGTAYRNLSQYQQALEFHKQALDIYREVGNRQREGGSLENIAVVYEKLAQSSQALKFYGQALDIYMEVGDRRGEARMLSQIALYYYVWRGDASKALAIYEEALTIQREIGDRVGESRTLNNIGYHYIKLNQYTRGLEFLEQALAIDRKIGSRFTEGVALNNIGVIQLVLGNKEKGLESLQQSLAIRREVGDREGEAVTLTLIGSTLQFTNGKLQEAEEMLLTAVNVWESLRPGLTDENKVSLFDKLIDPYRYLQQVLITQNKITVALEIAERGRARAFVDLLAQRLSSQEAAQFESPKPLSIQQIQQIARVQNATLVQYSNFSDELYIWVVKPTGEVAFNQVDVQKVLNTSLENLITDSRQSIGVRGRDILDVTFEPTPEQSDRLKQLHKLLIEPIAQYLPTNPSDRVIFIPQNELFLVPFPALQDDGGKYLIEKHTILTAPSIQVLQLTQQKRQAVSGDGVLVVGNPTMPSVTTTVGEPSQQLTNLPGAEKEATEIAKLLNTKALTGKQATKAAILPKLSNARIIHLATHGLLDDFKGLDVPGAIALAPNGTGELNDGLLTSNEIFDLKLNAELVVLSACDTGRGKLTGDGVIGLSRSLITAGVPSVIVSLWSVPDAPTASLMTQFYQNLKQNPDKAQALRQAMLTTMATHPNPKDWAAFTLIGEAQ